MNPPFLLLLAAAAIFRFLSADSNKAFRARLARLLPRNVMRDHFKVLLEEFPDRLPEFRRRVLPYSALYVALNAAACGCFIIALWAFPPSGMAHWDLIFVRYGSVIVTPLAFVADVVSFGRVLMSTFGKGEKLGITDSKLEVD